MVTANNVRLDVSFFADEEGSYLYAPTHIPYGGSCLEVTFAHYLPPGESIERHEFWVWDHCEENGRILIEDMTDLTWQDKYVREWGDPSAEMAYAEIIKDGTCWSAELYNYQDGTYDEKGYSCESRGSASQGWEDGWTMWELESPTADLQEECNDRRSIWAAQVELITQLGSSSVSLEDAEFSNDAFPFENGVCFDSGHSTWRMEFHESEGWHAYTPNSF